MNYQEFCALIRPSFDAISPPPDRTADEWADQNRILPAGSAEPGPWRTSRTPYMIPIMRACSNPRYRRIVVVTGAQSGKTDALINVMGHRLDDDPVPMLFVSPTQKLVESVSNSRVMAMFRTVPSLWEKLSKGKMNKMTEKFISGVRLGFGWAGSATELSSHPCGLVLMDERDRMDDDIQGEGDPVDLCEARTATYPSGKVIICSTPTVEGASAIWALWESGTKKKWSWPCPYCGKFFAPERKLLRWPEDATPAIAWREAYIECPSCAGKIVELHKKKMNDNGKFIGPGQDVDCDGNIIGDDIDTNCGSFLVSGLASPWRSIGDRARAWVTAEASRKVSSIQAVINTGFGELYAIKGDAPDWLTVANLRQGYEFLTLPEGVQELTCGVDVHGNRIDYVIRGWGYKMESWLIDAGHLLGNTEQDDIWNALGEILQRPIEGKYIRRMLVDSGYKPGAGRIAVNMVYMFCRRFSSYAFPSKGHAQQDRPFKSSLIDVSAYGIIIKNGLQLWHIDSDVAKTWVHTRVRWPVGASGAWHLSADADDDYCKQIVSESRILMPTGVAKWIVTGENHFLDCESLAYAAAMMLNFETLPGKSGPARKTFNRVRSKGIEG